MSEANQEGPVKVTDRRWWARGGDEPVSAEEPKLKPSYVEELEARIASKDAELHQLLVKYRTANEEFDQARARLRKEVTKDVERGRRALIVSFLEVLDNLDRALDAAGDGATHPVVQGVEMVRRQFLATLEGLGVTRLAPTGEPFDPSRHEAVATVASTNDFAPGTIVGVVKPGYLIGEDVLRPAQVAVAG